MEVFVLVLLSDVLGVEVFLLVATASGGDGLFFVGTQTPGTRKSRRIGKVGREVVKKA